MIGGDGGGADKDRFSRILRDGREGGHGGRGGTPGVVRLGRALDGLDEPFDGGLVVLAPGQILLAQAAYALRYR